jgi:hypothetical protein
MWKILSFVLSILGHKTASGSIFLSPAGSQTVKIHTEFKPKEVWICPNEQHGVPVCQGSCDCFDVKIVPHGFVLLANLASEYREVQWIAFK